MKIALLTAAIGLLSAGHQTPEPRTVPAPPTFGINLNAEEPFGPQFKLAKSIGVTKVRLQPHFWGSPINFIQSTTGVGLVDAEPLWNLAYADPEKGGEHRAVVGAEVETFAIRCGLIARLAHMKVMEIGNEPNGTAFGAYKPEEFAALVKATLPKLFEAGVQRVWIGGLDASKPNVLKFAKAFKDAKLFEDPRVGLSWHLYRPQAQIGTTLLYGREMFRPYIEPKRQLVTEIGFQDGEAPVTTSAADLATSPARIWTSSVTTPVPLTTYVDPRGGTAYFQSIGNLEPGYHRVTLTVRAAEWSRIKIGTYGEEEAVEVLVGPKPRTISVVVKTAARAAGKGRTFDVVTTVPLWCGTPKTERLEWDDARFAQERLWSREWEARSAWQTAVDLDLAGAYVYTLTNVHNQTYGVTTATGVSKASVVTTASG